MISEKIYFSTLSNLSFRMKLNWNSQIVGSKVILVPYGPQHVPKYHQWMKSPELQHLTGSEPLTFEEEIEMQETWKNSDDKCTFIVLHRETFNQNNNEIEAMIGDTNVFIKKDDDINIGEAEIMIAETSFRGQHLGWQAMILMLLYGINNLKIDVFEVKIKIENKNSIKMFGKLQFTEVSRSEVFGEVTFMVKVTKDWIAFLENIAGQFELKEYEH